MERLLRPSEAKELIGCELSTIYAWAYKGKIPSIKIGKLLRFSPTSLAKWISQHERKAK